MHDYMKALYHRFETPSERAEKPDFTKAGQYNVGQWLDLWLEDYAKLKVRPSTYQTYQGFIKHHVKPNIGSIPLLKLTTMALQKMYKKLLESGRVDRTEAKDKPKGLSTKTVRNIHQMVSSALRFAMEQKLIRENPATRCALPKVERKEMKTLPMDQLNAFFDEAKRTGVFELYYIDLLTGLRRGELLGLKRDDIDFKNGILHVRRQVMRQDGIMVEAPLKTKNSYRSIAIPADAVEVLKVQRDRIGNGSGACVSLSYRRPHVLRQRSSHAPEDTETGMTETNQISGTPSSLWPYKTAWMRKPCPVCWDTTPQASPSTPTPR